MAAARPRAIGLVVHQTGQVRYAGHGCETARVAGDLRQHEQPLGSFAAEVPLGDASASRGAAWLGVGLAEGTAGSMVLVSMLVRPVQQSVSFGLLDAARTPLSWAACGTLLSRQEALAHSRRAEFFAAAEAVVGALPVLHAFCAGPTAVPAGGRSAHPAGGTCATCGSAVARLLDIGMVWPDAIAALPPAERTGRVWQDGPDRPDFVVLDGSRCFVRCLLPVPLADGAEFRYGSWLEVDQQEFERIKRTWNDEPAHGVLRFRARLASALEPWGGAVLGTEIEAAPRKFADRPYVVSAQQPSQAAALRDGRDDETYRTVVSPHVE